MYPASGMSGSAFKFTAAAPTRSGGSSAAAAMARKRKTGRKNRRRRFMEHRHLRRVSILCSTAFNDGDRVTAGAAADSERIRPDAERVSSQFSAKQTPQSLR